MSLPYNLASIADISGTDPTRVIMGKSFYYSDVSPLLKQSSSVRDILQYDAQAVVGQIELIIGTPIGSEEHEPTFGCNVLRMVFSNMTQTNYTALEMEIQGALRLWLGQRIDFVAVTTFKDPTRGDVIAAITFRIKLSGEQFTCACNLSTMASSASK